MTGTIKKTEAWCPDCHTKIAAKLVERGGKVYLAKKCAKHGASEVLVSGSSRWYHASTAYVKPAQKPLAYKMDYKGCPDSCGFCTRHKQHTCLPVIEILDRCDMDCPICLKSFDGSFEFSEADFRGALGGVLDTEERCQVINLSGGEPTLHPRLPQFLRYAAGKGVLQTTVSTNGLRLLADKKLRDTFRKTGAIAALQFDGFTPKTWQFMRGQPDLLAKKLKLIELFDKEGIKYSLVATIAKGVNDGEVTALTDFFFRSKAASLMFQPLCFTGRAAALAEKYRITIPDIVQFAERGDFCRKGDFNPLPCSHYSCFALAYYLKAQDGKFVSLKDFIGRDLYLDLIANKTLPGLDAAAFASVRQKLYALWSAADTSAGDAAVLGRIRKILRSMERDGFSPKAALQAGMGEMKAVFIHSFMDAHNLDFDRLQKCCNPYAKAGGRLVPMCAQNACFS